MNFKNMGEAAPPQYGGSGLIRSLSRQASIYSLTLEEFQSSMGGIQKDFGSMNMDEFLKNIWTAEEAQGLALGSTGAAEEGGGAAAARNLQRQGSLTLPRTLSQKTVDEVWKDLYKEGVVREDAQSMAPAEKFDDGNGMIYSGMPRPGALALGNQVMGINGNSQVPNQSPNLGINGNGERLIQQQQQLFPNQPAVIHLANKGFVQGGGMGGGGGVGIVGGGTDGGVTVAAVPTMSPLSSDGPGNDNNSSLSPVSYMFNGSVGRKRRGGIVEKVVERRQKRMIKNRESAARSRARKQAYTMELETEAEKLREENKELQKKQEEIMEMQKNQVSTWINEMTPKL
ncbi:hypothetical protein Sjap_022441 [Stephania japonica]|uniref:BZIP domain-containing protein n=1 Tax=Stephania japonica TaxID=461633 RepID=A0AAP0HST8_9MAGN